MRRLGDSKINAIRWILLLPAVVEVWFLVVLISMVVDVWFRGAPCREDPELFRCKYSEILVMLHLHLSAGVAAIAVILVGYWFAPSHKKYTSYALLVGGSVFAFDMAKGDWSLILIAVTFGIAAVLYVNRERA